MLSTPPARTRSASPQRRAHAAPMTASIPEAQSRLTVTAGTVSGSSDKNTAMPATLRLSSLAWLAHPRTTSSSAAGVKSGNALLQLADGNCRQIVRANRRQRAAKASDGRADIIADEYPVHSAFRASTAVASISTSASSSTRANTTTMVMAGKCRPRTLR